MNTNWSGRKTLVAALALSALAFAAGMGVLFFGWLILRAFGASPDFWAMTEAVATAAAAATVFGAGVFAFLELAETSKSRYIAVADRLFEELNAAENIAARRWIFLHLPPDPATGLAELTDEQRDQVKRVLNSLDRVAFLTQAGWIPDDLIMPWMNPMIVKVWDKLKAYIEYERQRRHEPDYYRQVSALAERCIAWRAAHVPNAEITWVDHAL